MKRRVVAACVLGIAWALVGCGSDGDSYMALMTRAEWKDEPGSLAEVGYWVYVDFGWPDRASAKSCTPLSPNLHVTVNGREGTKTPSMNGDCEWDILFEAGPFQPDEPQPTTVRAFDGNRQLGEAIYRGLFPGYAAQLASPADGKAHLGDNVVLSVLSPLPDQGIFADEYATSYWLDSPDGVPPYHEYLWSTIAPDRLSITVGPPTRTGRTALIGGPYFKDLTGAESCTGFASCTGWPSATVGPVFVEFVP